MSVSHFALFFDIASSRRTEKFAVRIWKHGLIITMRDLIV